MLKENPFSPSSLQAAKYKREPREIREAIGHQCPAVALSALPFAPILSSHAGGVHSNTAGASSCRGSVAQLCPTLGDPMDCNHLTLCRPLLLLPSIFPNIKVFSNESVLHIRWPKYWSFSLSISPSNEYSNIQ